MQGKIIKSNSFSFKIPRQVAREQAVQAAFQADEKYSDCKMRALDFPAVACLPA